MSSPPPSATSPTSSNGFQLPRKRGPGMPLPTQNKRRKPSIASAASHPLRQTSFPPERNGDGSSPARQGSFSPSVSSFGGRAKAKKKRPGVGRSTTGAATAKDGDDRSVDRHSSQVDGVGGQEEDAEDDEDDGAGAVEAMLEGGGLVSNAARKQYDSMLLDAFTPEQADRYENYRRVRLNKKKLKTLINQTLSQSVGDPICNAVNGMTKVFAGQLIERAREVQAEWLIADRMSKEPKHPGAVSQRPRSQQSVSQQSAAVNGASAASASDTNNTQNISLVESPGTGGQTVVDSQGLTQNDTSADATQDAGHQAEPEVHNVLDVNERDRGPLTPDHLREALRRYKKDRVGGSAGFQGLSHLGREATASRVGCRRLFR